MLNAQAMKIHLIDNYDSFTYNLVHLLKGISGAEVETFRNDQFQWDEIYSCDFLMSSPGPGVPHQAGELLNVIRNLPPHLPYLGVCLGMQALAEVYSSPLRNLEQVYHGLATPIQILNQDRGLFSGLDEIIEVGRYHSWVVDAEKISEELEILAIDESAQVMAVKHQRLPRFGVQFHPESVLTPNGQVIIENFIRHAADDRLN